jgi:hypothetical protein
MIGKKFHHNSGPPVYGLPEMLKIINSYTKKVKTPEHELNEY